MGIVFTYLFLVAQYESWSVPAAVMLSVSVAVLGALASLGLAGIAIDVYAQIGLVFLGLVPFSSSNWATMIQLAWVRGSIFFADSVYYILAPIAAISLFQLSLVSFSRALDEIVNPRLRAGDA